MSTTKCTEEQTTTPDLNCYSEEEQSSPYVPMHLTMVNSDGVTELYLNPSHPSVRQRPPTLDEEYEEERRQLDRIRKENILDQMLMRQEISNREVDLFYSDWIDAEPLYDDEPEFIDAGEFIDDDILTYRFPHQLLAGVQIDRPIRGSRSD